MDQRQLASSLEQSTPWSSLLMQRLNRLLARFSLQIGTGRYRKTESARTHRKRTQKPLLSLLRALPWQLCASSLNFGEVADGHHHELTLNAAMKMERRDIVQSNLGERDFPTSCCLFVSIFSLISLISSMSISFFLVVVVVVSPRPPCRRLGRRVVRRTRNQRRAESAWPKPSATFISSSSSADRCRLTLEKSSLTLSLPAAVPARRRKGDDSKPRWSQTSWAACWRPSCEKAA